jgi:hypothetical protein
VGRYPTDLREHIYRSVDVVLEGGVSQRETASLLSVSRATVKRVVDARGGSDGVLKMPKAKYAVHRLVSKARREAAINWWTSGGGDKLLVRESEKAKDMCGRADDLHRIFWM